MAMGTSLMGDRPLFAKVADQAHPCCYEQRQSESRNAAEPGRFSQPPDTRAAFLWFLLERRHTVQLLEPLSDDFHRSF